jgi:hypothetical protein
MFGAEQPRSTTRCSRDRPCQPRPVPPGSHLPATLVASGIAPAPRPLQPAPPAPCGLLTITEARTSASGAHSDGQCHPDRPKPVNYHCPSGKSNPVKHRCHSHQSKPVNYYCHSEAPDLTPRADGGRGISALRDAIRPLVPTVAYAPATAARASASGAINGQSPGTFVAAPATFTPCPARQPRRARGYNSGWSLVQADRPWPPGLPTAATLVSFSHIRACNSFLQVPGVHQRIAVRMIFPWPASIVRTKRSRTSAHPRMSGAFGWSRKRQRTDRAVPCRSQHRCRPGSGGREIP